ncbi:hypothetical protein [Collinsella aerofaciens]|uniref:hypothetical protein n=1 Tax=Collinsella aerofaciens TaxID=74426 RepID=UPI001D02117F|nr:hypothetical protein [Collinsella aerofaciens]MCB5366937.1 hypothetical protein [Collinsella aerofaciens]MCB5369013.1 hypothetical protein [Collinsella aerofaciens]
MAEKPSILQNISTAAIRTDMLDNVVNQASLPALWEKSYLCPCRDRATRQPNQSCKLCHGRGIAFLPPRPLNIIITSQEKGIFNGDLGLFDSGTAIGTPERGVKVAFRDRITLPNVTVSQSFIFDVTQRRVEQGFYMIYDVKNIDFATSMKGELTEGVDYTWDRERNLFFPNESLLGENVSINIQTTLRYMVADLLKEHRYARDTQGRLVSLSQKLLLKREDIFIDKEAFESGVSDSEVGKMIDTKRPPAIDGLNGFFRNSGGSNG